MLRGKDGADAQGRGADKKILIPLTSSLYVPGRLKDAENVIVDVGTGYFVEKVRTARRRKGELLGGKGAAPPRLGSFQYPQRLSTTHYLR